MKDFALLVLILALFCGWIALAPPAAAQDPAQTEQVSENAAQQTLTLPQLSEIVSLSATLRIQLAALEDEVEAILAPQGMEQILQVIRERTESLADQFNQIQEARDYTLNTINSLHDAVNQEVKALDDASLPVVQAIQRLGEDRETWLAEKMQWTDWQRRAVEERGLDQLQPVFQEANQTINTALNLILPRLDELFTVQGRGADIGVRLNVLANELDKMIIAERRGGQARGSAPMLSVGFFAQFLDAEYWIAVLRAPLEMTLPGTRFLAEHGWILLLQIGLTAAVAIPVLPFAGVGRVQPESLVFSQGNGKKGRA